MARAVVRRSLFYDLVGVALTAYAHAAYRLRTVGEPLELAPSTLIVTNHPRECDPVVFAGALYRHVHRFGREHRLVHFMLRPDMIQRGFFAGMPLSLPLPVRRLLFPLCVGPILERFLPCAPIRAAGTMLVVDLVRGEPDAPLRELLPPDDIARLRKRALEQGRPEPQFARDVDRGIYADLLWWVVRAENAPSELAHALFARRAPEARADLEHHAEVIRRGGALLISPEGKASDDGSLRELRRGAALIVRRAKPERVVPLSVAYDSLTTGRPWAFVAGGAPVPPEDARTDEALRDLLARAFPLTVGQVVADALEAGETALLERRLANEVEEALAQGRPLDRELLHPEVRRARLRDALAASELHSERLPRLVAAYRSTRAT